MYEALESMNIDVLGKKEKKKEEIDITVPEGISIDDPVRMYLKGKSGKIPLLTPEEEK